MQNQNHNLYHLFQERFCNTDCFIRDSDGRDVYSYGDLDQFSAAYAARLSSLGATPGDRIIVQAEKSAECLFIYFACLRAGLVYLPLNTAYQPEELSYFVGNAEPALIICSPEQQSVFEKFAPCPIKTLDRDGRGTVSADLEMLPFNTVERSPDDLAAILYTSGTTGKPKGAMLSHGNLTANVATLHKTWGWVDGDVLLHALPIFHVHGLFVATHLAVYNSSPMIFLNSFNAEQAIGLLPLSTVYMGVPTNYTRLLANPTLNADACANMRLFISGSAPLLVQTFNEFQTRTGHTILERYGMTETGMNTSNPLTGPRKPGTVGPPLLGTSIKVIDDNGDSVAAGETGNLLVAGPNVFSGYWRMPEKNAEEFVDGYFRTGDLAFVDPEGYVSIVGRSKDLIITGGLNVYPKEIESVIDKIPGVLESAVIGLEDPDFGEAVTAIVVKELESAEIDEVAIVQHLKQTLANFKVAKSVYFVDELPRNAMGKVQKNKLREDFG
jgi:malonyl-CoA/methylmalonyl-CoA synthetase